MGDLASARNVLGKLKDLLTTMPSPSDSAYRDNLAGEIALAEARSAEAERLFSASLAAYPLALSHQGWRAFTKYSKTGQWLLRNGKHS
jgi:hypothetical protein